MAAVDWGPPLSALLDKKSPKGFSWQTRSFTLKDGEFSYCKKPGDATLGAFPTYAIDDGVVGGQGDKIVFTTAGRTWQLRANNGRDAEKWRHEITKSIKVWKTLGKVPGSLNIDSDKFWKGSGMMTVAPIRSRDRDRARAGTSDAADDALSLGFARKDSTTSLGSTAQATGADEEDDAPRKKGGWMTAGEGFKVKTVEVEGTTRFRACSILEGVGDDDDHDANMVPYLEAYLNKQFAKGTVLSTVSWHKRWFVLNDVRLYLYKAANCEQIVSCVQTSQISRLELSSSKETLGHTVLDIHVNGFSSMVVEADSREETLKWARFLLLSHRRGGGTKVTEVIGLPKSKVSRVVKEADRLNEAQKTAQVDRDMKAAQAWLEKELHQRALAAAADSGKVLEKDELSEALMLCNRFCESLWELLDDIATNAPPRPDVAQDYITYYMAHLAHVMHPFLERPAYSLRRLLYLIQWVTDVEERVLRAAAVDHPSWNLMSDVETWGEVVEKIAPQRETWAFLPKENAPQIMGRVVSGVVSGVVGGIGGAVGAGDKAKMKYKRRYFRLRNRAVAYYKAKGGTDAVHNGTEQPSEIIETNTIREVKRLMSKPRDVHLVIARADAEDEEHVKFSHDVEDICERIREEVDAGNFPLRDATVGARIVPNCFMGAELVDLIIDMGLGFEDREHAIVLCEQMMEEKAMQCTHGDDAQTDFQDDHTMYRFYWEERNESLAKTTWDMTIRFETEAEAEDWAAAIKCYVSHNSADGNEIAFADMGPVIPESVVLFDKDGAQEVDDDIQKKFLAKIPSRAEALDELLGKVDEIMDLMTRELDDLLYCRQFRGDVYDCVFKGYASRIEQVVHAYCRDAQMTWDVAETLQLLMWIESHAAQFDDYAIRCELEDKHKPKRVQDIPEISVFITAYIEHVTDMMRKMYKNIVDREIDEPDIQQDGGGNLYTMAAVDAFQIFDQQLMLVVPTRNEELKFKVASACLGMMEDYQQLLVKAVCDRLPALQLEQVCAYSNNCSRCIANMGDMNSKIQTLLTPESMDKLPFEQVETAFNRNAKTCVEFVPTIMWRDLAELCRQLCTERWVSEEGIMGTILATISDFAEDLQAYLEKPLFRKCISDVLDQLVESFLSSLLHRKAVADDAVIGRLEEDLQTMREWFGEHLRDRAVEERMKPLQECYELLGADEEMIEMYTGGLIATTDIHPGVFKRLFDMRPNLDNTKKKDLMQKIFDSYPDDNDEDATKSVTSLGSGKGHDKKRCVFGKMDIPVAVDQAKEKARQQRKQEKERQDQLRRFDEEERKKVEAMQHRRRGMADVLGAEAATCINRDEKSSGGSDAGGGAGGGAGEGAGAGGGGNRRNSEQGASPSTLAPVMSLDDMDHRPSASAHAAAAGNDSASTAAPKLNPEAVINKFASKFSVFKNRLEKAVEDL